MDFNERTGGSVYLKGASLTRHKKCKKERKESANNTEALWNKKDGKGKL